MSSISGAGGLTPPMDDLAAEQPAPPEAPTAEAAASPFARSFGLSARGGILAALARGAAEFAERVAEAAANETRPGEELPETLLRGDLATVKHGTDPGDFYCEHMFYVSQLEAAREGSAVVKNAANEPLVGFLHVPPDDFTYVAGGDYSQADRHGATREVIAAALGGYVEQAFTATDEEPLRVLLTGYDTFQTVVDNPTASFVSHRENLDASLQAAFGDRLLTREGERVPGDLADGGEVLAYRVVDQQGKEREVRVQLRAFPVSDDALDGERAGSIQHTMRGFRPHAVLAMGVSGESHYMAEHHADDGGLRADRGDRFSHSWSERPDTAQPENYSLARAILRHAGPVDG